MDRFSARLLALALLIFCKASWATYNSGDLIIQIYDPLLGNTLVADLQVPISSSAPTGQIAYAIPGWPAFLTMAGPPSSFEYSILGGSSRGNGDVGSSGPGATQRTALENLFGSTTGAQGQMISALLGSSTPYAIVAPGLPGSWSSTDTAGAFGVGTLGNVVDPPSLYYFNATNSLVNPALIAPIFLFPAAGQLLIGNPPTSAVSSSDGPMPLWALAALGAGLLGIASRRLGIPMPAARRSKRAPTRL